MSEVTIVMSRAGNRELRISVKDTGKDIDLMTCCATRCAIEKELAAVCISVALDRLAPK